MKVWRMYSSPQDTACIKWRTVWDYKFQEDSAAARRKRKEKPEFRAVLGCSMRS